MATTDTALQFPAHDPAALAERVERLMNEPALRTRLAAAALAVAQTRTWDSIFDRLIVDYFEAVPSLAGLRVIANR